MITTVGLEFLIAFIFGTTGLNDEGEAGSLSRRRFGADALSLLISGTLGFAAGARLEDSTGSEVNWSTSESESSESGRTAIEGASLTGVFIGSCTGGSVA